MDIFDSHYVQVALAILSALILFFFAIENLSKEIQQLASERFREVIAKVAHNTYLGALTGAIATAIIQSSSAVTVITVILVNTGIISFRNSLGIILGSNVGTTITAQLALINSTVLPYILIILGFLLNFIHKRGKIVAKPIFFLGVILFSLSLLSSNITPLKNDPDIIAIFSYLSNPLLAYFVGMVITAIVHSSSIVSGILVILAQTGIVPIEVTIPMILGANVGSSATGFLAALKLNLHARRVGFSNILFNLIGSLLFMILLYPFISVLQSLSSDPAVQTALAHFLFNITTTLLFLGFLPQLEALVIKLVKGNEEEILFKTKYLKENEKKRIKVKQRILNINKEITYSIENTIKIYQLAISVFYHPTNLTTMNIHKLETLNDFLDDEITKNILELYKNKLSKKSAKSAVTLIKVSNSIEQLGDLGRDFSEVFERMHKLGIPYKDVDIERLTDIHNRLIHLFRDIEKNILTTSEKRLALIKVKEEDIYSMIKEDFDTHVERLQKEEKYDGHIFVDAISILELSVSKVRDIRKSLQKLLRES